MSPQSSPVVTEVRRAQVDGRLRQAAVSLKPPTINGAGAGGGKEEARHVDAARGCRCFSRNRSTPGLRMSTGRVRIGWSLRAPKTETRNRNPNPKPIRWKSITKTKPADTRNPNRYPKPADKYTHIHMYNKRQQIINIFMTQLSINLIV